MGKHELITRNIIEIVTEPELNKLLKEKKNPSVYCGYETSGPVHIGTMLSISKLLDFQEAGLKVKVLFADLHTWLNKKGDFEWVKNSVNYWQHCCRALGLEKEFVLGSDFQFNKKYITDLFAMGVNTTANRALRSMQKVARDIEHAHVSQINYPLMQALDIAHLNLDIAYGGIEQRKIHMLAREELPKIGYKAPVCLHSPLIVSLKGPDEKMSSSKPETFITIHDSEQTIETRINAAHCPAGEIEGNPILQIAKYLIFPKINKLKIEREKKFGGDIEFKDYTELEKAYKNNKLHPQDLKSGVSGALMDVLKPVRKYFEKADAQKSLNILGAK